MARTTTDLVNSVKRRAQLPDDGGTLSDTDILAFATDELLNVVFPRLMSIHEWHNAFYYNITLSATRQYRLHKRISGNSIISVEYYDGTSYRFIRLKHPLLQRIDLGENYAILGNNLVLSDAVPTSGTLRIRAFLRPSELLAANSTGCSSISAVSGTLPSNITLTVGSTTGYSTGSEIDIVYESTPYEMALIGTVSSVSDATHLIVTGATALYQGQDFPSSDIRIVPGGQSDRIMIPDELHDFLAQRVAIRCMEARGFTGDMNNHLRKLEDLEKAFDRLMSPRNKGEFKAINREDWLFIGRV